MISKEEFFSICNNIIPQEEIDIYNKKTKKMWLTLALVLTIELVMTIVVALSWSSAIIPIMLIIAAVSVTTIIVTMKYSWQNFKSKYSGQVFECLLKGYKHNYHQSAFIHQSIFNKSGFGKRYDRYTGEDLLTIDIPKDNGTPSGIKLSISDLFVTRQEETTTIRNGKYYTEKRTVIVYKGVFAYVNFPFKFKCGMGLNIGFSGQKQIKLEDIEFNKKFKTYTNNQLEALVILTPTLITKLLELSKKTGKLMVSLTEFGTLYFGMQNNLFKLKQIGKPSPQTFEDFYDDISIILAIINEIKDNNKVFKM